MKPGGVSPGSFAPLLRRVVPAASILTAAGAALAVTLEARAAAVPPAARETLGQTRPFTHERHAKLACAECHGTGPQHGRMRVRTDRDCAACHHDERRNYACATCHAPATLPARPVASPMELSVWGETRLRELPFQHVRHAQVACRNCHVAPVTLRADVECRSCHQSHHRPEAECAQCHRRTDPPRHRRESHLTCAGSACHAPAVRERLTMSRNLCLVCHVEQREHEPGRNCAPCHIISRPPPAAAVP